MKKENAVVLVSGGMDSLVTTAIANEKYNLACLHINYGQKTEKRELIAFNDICDYYKVEKRLIINFEHLSKIGGSSLTDKTIEITKVDLSSTDIPTSYVPFRNANMLSVAVSWAETINAKKIFIGAVEEDSSGYPDCREVFYEAFNEVIKTGTKPDTKLEIVTPLIHLKKHEIVKLGMEMKVPFEKSWSCYKDEDLACGECDSCALRLRGFQQAGFDDPLKYKIIKQYYL
jgi:7-cyano-7-deazaguanine synthase